MNFPAIDWSLALSHLMSMAIAYLLALPVAWNREKSQLKIGLRTFPLVAVASCGYVLLSVRAFGADSQAMARIVEGLITGIGFIGGGAILKQGANVHGTATAASIWSTGAIGAAVAFGRYEIAVVLSIINFATFRLLTPLKHDLNDEDKVEENNEPEK
ncbi:MAG TPA: MgtC/SapB family protein [Blastocatellia bacterium]|jgi:putative Mg2+ transporter-C (MgtC) family protein